MRKFLYDQYFKELQTRGATVPRYLTSGEVMNGFKVGKEYNVFNSTTKETIKVRCTQNCPTHLIVIR